MRRPSTTLPAGWLAPVTLLLLGACSGATSSPALNPGVEMSARHARSITDGVERRTLDNGLTVLVKENPAAPVVAVVTHVKAGYFHEPDELSGVAHVIEHMFFNGTPTRPGPEDISRETRAHGGTLNAGTIYDRTSYYVVLPSERWRQGLEVQADALQNPLFDPEVLDNEMKAILQEARRKLDNPSAFGREKLYELAFDAHRIRRWRIGTEEVLNGLTRDDVLQWYTDLYRPQNIVLSIVGDVRADSVFTAVQELYGVMDKGHLRKNGGPAEPAQTALRYRRVPGDVHRSYVFLGYHTPGEGHRDNPALDVLATILGAGRSSRLDARLKQDLRVVTSIGASCYQYDDVGLFEIYATVEHDDLSRAAREMLIEVERLKLMGPTQDEIDRAMGILLIGEAMGQEEVLGQASTLAAYEAAGDIEDYDREIDALRRVTVEDVQRVANEYLVLSNASVLEYTSPRAGEGLSPEAFADDIHGHLLAAVREMKEPQPYALGESLRPREELAKWDARFAAGLGIESTPGRQHFDLPGGSTLVVEENPTAPTVSAGVYFRGGRIGEFQNIGGITQLMQRVMVKETQGRTAEQLAQEIEGFGTQVGRVATEDWFGFTSSSLSAQFASTFDVLFDVVARPSFSEQQVELERELHLYAIGALEDQPVPLSMMFTRGALYGEHPYGFPTPGVFRSVRFLGADRIAEHYEEVVHPETMVIVVSGDVDAQAVFEFVSGYTANFEGKGEKLPATAEAFYDPERFERIPSLLSVRENEYQKNLAQSSMMLFYPTVTLDDPDAPALDVLQAITGGLGGTFFEEVRGKRGLAYSVSTFSVNRILAGFFGTYVACSPDKAAEVRDLVVELHNGLALDPPDEESIARAKNALAGGWKVAGQTNGARMSRLATLELAGLDLSMADDYHERIGAVTREDLVRVAQQYFLDRPYAFGIVAGSEERDANPQK